MNYSYDQPHSTRQTKSAISGERPFENQAYTGEVFIKAATFMDSHVTDDLKWASTACK